MEKDEVTPKKSKTTLFVIVGVIIVCSMLYIVFRFKQSQISNQTADSQTVKEIKLSEISAHNGKDNCWTAINGEVFDVTKFIGMHKGGDRILSACGIDATELFTGKSPMGRVHSKMATKILRGMKIGTLQ